MLKAYKYRLYPTPDQAVMLAKHFGCVRFVYNRALFERKNAYEQEKRTIKCNDQIKELRTLKRAEETLWLGAKCTRNRFKCV